MGFGELFHSVKDKIIWSSSAVLSNIGKDYYCYFVSSNRDHL